MRDGISGFNFLNHLFIEQKKIAGFVIPQKIMDADMYLMLGIRAERYMLFGLQFKITLYTGAGFKGFYFFYKSISLFVAIADLSCAVNQHHTFIKGIEHQHERFYAATIFFKNLVKLILCFGEHTVLSISLLFRQ